MVFYFTSTVVDPPATLFMGIDKHENEDLIRWGFPEDVWFHVDKLSSAHVYLRLQPGQTMDEIHPALVEDCAQLVEAKSIQGNNHYFQLSSAHVYLRLQPGQTMDEIHPALVEDCAQLVKANSIQGNKINNLKVVYTPWENLKKTGDMAVGQVGFHSDKNVTLIAVEKRINEIVNRLNKTKIEKTEVDFRAQREERDRQEREKQRAVDRERKDREKETTKRKEEEKKLKHYDSLFENTDMTSNKDTGYDSDDFM